MKFCYRKNGLEFDLVDDSYVAEVGQTVVDDFLPHNVRAGVIPTFTAAWNALSLEKKFNILYYELVYFDGIVPRGLEDFWSVSGFNTETLPSHTKQVLIWKSQTRDLIRSLS